MGDNGRAREGQGQPLFKETTELRSSQNNPFSMPIQPCPGPLLRITRAPIVGPAPAQKPRQRLAADDTDSHYPIHDKLQQKSECGIQTNIQSSSAASSGLHQKQLLLLQQHSKDTGMQLGLNPKKCHHQLLVWQRPTQLQKAQFIVTSTPSLLHPVAKNMQPKYTAARELCGIECSAPLLQNLHVSQNFGAYERPTNTKD